MKSDFISFSQSKISLKAIKPEENIFEVYPTEKYKKTFPKRKFFSSAEFTPQLSLNTTQNNIKEIIEEMNYKGILPSINESSFPVVHKYLKEIHNLKLNKKNQKLSNVNFLYFPNNVHKKIYSDMSLINFINSDYLYNENELNQELYLKLIFFYSLSKKIGKKERNLISNYIINKIKLKNCTIVPPDCVVQNKFVKILLMKIDNIIKNKMNKNLSINLDQINNIVQKEIDILKFKIKQGIVKFRTNNNNENTFTENFKNEYLKCLNFGKKGNITPKNNNYSIQYFQNPKRQLSSNKENYTNYLNDNEKEEEKLIYEKNNYYDHFHDSDSDKLSLSSLVNNRNNKYFSKGHNSHININRNKRFSQKHNNILIEYYDENGNKIDDDKSIILFDEKGNEISNLDLNNKEMKYFNKEGKEIIVALKNINKKNYENNKNNNIDSIKDYNNNNHHYLDKLIDRKGNFSQNNLNERTINSSKNSNNNTIEYETLNKKEWENKIGKIKEKQEENNLIKTEIYENENNISNSLSSSDIEGKENENEKEKIMNNLHNIKLSNQKLRSKKSLKRNIKIPLNNIDSGDRKHFIKSNALTSRKNNLKNNLNLNRKIKTSLGSIKLIKKIKNKKLKSKEKKKVKDNENDKDNENEEEKNIQNINENINNEIKIKKQFLTQTNSKTTILNNIEKEEKEKEKEEISIERNKNYYYNEKVNKIENDLKNNLTIQKTTKSKADSKIINLLREKDKIQKLSLRPSSFEENEINDNNNNDTFYEWKIKEIKNNNNNDSNIRQINYTKVGNENFLIYKGKDYFNKKKENNYNLDLKNEFSSLVKNGLNVEENQNKLITKKEKEKKPISKKKNSLMYYNNYKNLKDNNKEKEEEKKEEKKKEEKKYNKTQYIKTPINMKKLIKLNTLKKKLDDSLNNNLEEGVPLPIKKATSRSETENKNDNKNSMNKLLENIKKLKNLSEEEYNKEIFFLIDHQIENIEIAKRQNKAERIKVFVDSLNYFRKSKMQYHKILSEKLIFKEPFNFRSLSDEKTFSKRNNNIKGNLLELIKK